MKLDTKHSLKLEAALVLPLTVLVILLSMAGYFTPAAQAADVALPTTFATPSEAGQALREASRADDLGELQRILGADPQALLSSGDSEDDKAARHSFVTKYDQMSRWVAMTDGSEVLYIGADNYPFPIPLVQNASSRWHFDIAAGKDEILARRIGRNELLAIDASSAIAEAQQQYFHTAHDGDSAHEYAERIISTDGKQDGLYWAASPQQGVSPLGILAELPKPSLGPLTPGEPFALDGYTLRILTAQGDSASGEAKNYTVNGKMTGGFAILASPVKYGETGIMSFITGSDGAVYERNLGTETNKIAASIQEFNPTEDWTPME